MVRSITILDLRLDHLGRLILVWLGKLHVLRFMKMIELMALTVVSSCSLQRQSINANEGQKKAAKSLRPHIDHMNSNDKTIQTRTFLLMGAPSPGYASQPW